MENQTSNYGPSIDSSTKWQIPKFSLLWTFAILYTVSAGLYYFRAAESNTEDIGHLQSEVFELKSSSPTCEVTKFMEIQRSKNISLSASALSLVEACKLVLFTRTPKCGSRTVRDVFVKLANMHNFRAKMKGKYSFVKAVGELSREDGFQPMAITGHEPFRSYSTGKKGEDVVNVNIIRDPIEHLISVYSFLKYGSVMNDRGRSGVRTPSKRYQKSLESCLTDRGLRPPCIRDSYTSLRYLCGLAKNACKSRSQNQQRLEIAKKNVERYLLIGLTEDLSAFFEILEVFLPRMFRGSKEVYHHIKDASYGKWKSIHKDTLSNETRLFLQTELSADFEIYNFIKAQLYRTLKKVKDYKAIQIDNKRTITWSIELKHGLNIS